MLLVLTLAHTDCVSSSLDTTFAESSWADQHPIGYHWGLTGGPVMRVWSDIGGTAVL